MSNDDKVPEGYKKAANEVYNEMDDNTQFDDDQKKLRFAKLCMPASVVDFVMDHYGLFDLVEVNQISLYILKCLGIMEKDGWKFGIFRTKKDENGEESIESYGLDLHELVHQFRVKISEAMKSGKEYNPNITPGKEGIKDSGKE